MKKFLLTVVAIAIAATFIGTTVFLYQKSQEPPVVHQTTSAFVADIVKKTVATGRIVPRKEVAIKSKVSGVVSEIYVEAGDTINKGELIAKIELIPDMAYLSAAESELQKARINFANAQKELLRQQGLYQAELIPEFEFNKFQLQFHLAEEAVAAAENNVALIRDGASKSTGKVSNLVSATTSGTILDVPVKEGTFVIETNTFNEGTTIASIANMDDMIFEGQVDESEVGKLRTGMPLELSVGALGESAYTANLEYIAPKGTEDQGTIKFEIRAAVKLDKDYFLRAGYSANADIVLDRRSEVLAINESDLIVENNQSFVDLAVGEQQFERKAIETGLSDGINIEIISGLSREDKYKKL